MPQRDRIFVAIGVSRPGGGLEELPGVISASERMAAWGDAHGYIPVLLNDKLYPEITVDLLHREITAAINEVTDRTILKRLVVFFAGHGAARDIGDQYWVLTNWQQRSTEAVKVSALQRMLEYYGPQQVAVIGDACQEFSAKFIDLIGSAVLDRPDEEQQPFELDQFFAVDAGKQAFMIKAQDGDDAFCLFSEVLLDALEGDAPKRYREHQNGEDVLTSQGIALYLRDNVEKEAGKHGVRMVPRPRPGFFSDRVYLSIPPPTLVAWVPFPAGMSAGTGVPPELTPSDLGPTPIAARSVSKPNFSEPIGTRPDVDAEIAQLEASRVAQSNTYTKNVMDSAVRQSFETGCGVCVSGVNVRNAFASHADITPLGDDNPGWFRLNVGSSADSLAWSDVLVVLKDERVASVCAVNGFVAALHVFGNTGTNVIHRPIGESRYEGVAIVELLARANAGLLSDEEIVNAAAALRAGKHRIITLGSIVAQFYDAIRDTQSLRSIAAFYAMNHQPVPLDVVLFGGGTIRAEGDRLFADIPPTPKREPRSAVERELKYTFEATGEFSMHPIAGRVPWMRQAWSAVATADYHESAFEWRDRALDALPYLASGAFTVARAEGREAIMALAGIEDSQHEPEPLVAYA